MSYQSTRGLEWQGIGTSKGQWFALPSVDGLGAVSTDQVDSIARAAAMSSPANFVIVLVDRNGDVASVKTYESRAALLRDWDANYFNKLAGNIAFGLMMDKVNTVGGDPNVDMTTNPQIDVTKITKTAWNWKSAAPWIVGGAALIAGAILLSRSEKGVARRAARRRRFAPFRRRTVTVWR